MGGSIAERSADDLPPATFDFQAEEAVVGAISAQLESCDQKCVDRKLVASPVVDRQVERSSAALFLIANLAKPVLFDAG